MPNITFQHLKPEYFGVRSWYDLIPTGSSPSFQATMIGYLRSLDSFWPNRFDGANRARQRMLMERILSNAPQVSPAVPPKPEAPSPYVAPPSGDYSVDPGELTGQTTPKDAQTTIDAEQEYINQPPVVNPPGETLPPDTPTQPDRPKQGYFGNAFYSPSPQDGNMPHLYQWDPMNGGYQDKGRVSFADLERAEQGGGVKIVGDIGQMKQLAYQGGPMSNAQWDAANTPQAPQTPTVDLWSGMTYRGGQIYDATGRARSSIDAATRMRLQNMGYTFDAGANRYYGPGESAQPQVPDTPGPYVDLPKPRITRKPKSPYIPQPARVGASGAAGIY